MSANDAIRGILDRISERIATARRLSEFTCGDCEFQNQCGLPSTDDCPHRASQINRGVWKAKREAKRFSGITVGCAWKP